MTNAYFFSFLHRLLLDSSVAHATIQRLYQQGSDQQAPILFLDSD
jgi:hypothetical protein